MNILQEIRNQDITPHFLVVHRECKVIVRVRDTPTSRSMPSEYLAYKIILPSMTFILTQPLEHIETASSVYRDHTLPFVTGGSVMTQEVVNGSTVYHVWLDCINTTLMYTAYESILPSAVKRLCSMAIGCDDGTLKFEKIDVSSDTLKAMLEGILVTSSETSGLEDMWSFEAP